LIEVDYEEKFFVEILDFFRLGLNLSILSKDDIIEWADGHLLKNTLLAQKDVLIELSLSQNTSKKELSMFLGEIVGIKSTVLGSRLLLGKLYEINDLEKIALILDGFIQLMTLNEEHGLIEDIDFYFDKNSQLWGMEEELIDKYQEKAKLFFSFYREYRIENLNQIKEIDEKLSKKLFDFESF
jgi:hypothetical protein